jgi:peptide/nickel transport system ATP-binding protein
MFARQHHPYTRMLLSTIPRLDGPAKTILPTIEGSVPDIGNWPAGCRFSARCPLTDDICQQAPALEAIDHERHAACWHSNRVETIL